MRSSLGVMDSMSMSLRVSSKTFINDRLTEALGVGVGLPDSAPFGSGPNDSGPAFARIPQPPRPRPGRRFRREAPFADPPGTPEPRIGYSWRPRLYQSF